jgi:hypothetical protein
MAFGVATGHPWTFTAGLFGGASMAMWMCVRDLAVPEYIERWRVGAEGEKLTGRELRRLGAEWTARHDLAGRYGNVDHLVLGPAGVFMIDTKAWHRGVTSVDAAGPTVTPRHNPDAAWTWTRGPGRMRGAAAALSNALVAQTGRKVWVTAVVTVWGDFPSRVTEQDRVVYVAGDALAEWLEAQPRRLDANTLADLRRVFGGATP